MAIKFEPKKTNDTNEVLVDGVWWSVCRPLPHDVPGVTQSWFNQDRGWVHLGTPGEEHSCDEMGCSPLGAHVLKRVPAKPKPRSA